ncbi:MAG: hypothetical protein CXX80_00995 [Methanobacteriota archaeon]|nr:MAG: hypothetical protein CXX80_04940 [Euryarchaeota archaeon]PXY77306.1 MAG: hypothetical protein CXX80_00995 [Euryarchaeota archaeon]
MYRPYMRRQVGSKQLGLALVALLVANLVGSVASVELLKPDDDSGGDRSGIGEEYVLVIGRAWTVAEWSSLYSYDISPLRQLSFDSLLVWQPLGAGPVEWSGGHSAEPAEWKAGLDSTFPLPGQSILVILEPRLPHDAGNQLVNDLQRLGLQPSDLPDDMGASALPITIEAVWPSVGKSTLLDELLALQGVFWVEPVLEAGLRNEVSSAILQDGEVLSHPLWELGLAGEGIVVGIADTGLDRDHSCFRNASLAYGFGAEEDNVSATPGINHRKLLLLNETYDDWDDPGDVDGRHGSHTAGTLSCYDIDSFLATLNGDWDNATPGIMTAMAYDSRLVVQDLVGPSGWMEPPMDTLLWENSRNGGIIHSDSWGDATTSYTLRSHNLDAWMRENPWSLVFVAPGNNGGLVLEPANARSVVSVGASARDNSTTVYSQSSHGPLEDGRRGILILAPGMGIISAQSDGVHDSANGGARTSSGTSMATPMAASTTALIQQMIEDGWISRAGDNRSIVNSSGIIPGWSSYEGVGNISLGDGFTPSNNLLRALLTLSAEPLVGGHHKGLDLGSFPDEMQGWGRPNLSRLLDADSVNSSLVGDFLGTEGYVPAENIWIWDGFASDGDWVSALSARVDSPKIGGPLAKLSYSEWTGEGLAGPFLASGEEASWQLERVIGEDLDLRLSWSPKPAPGPVDDLQLVVVMGDGRFVVGDYFNDSGYSNLFVEPAFLNTLVGNNESTVGIRIPADLLGDSLWVEVRVRARNVTIGNFTGGLGIDGDRVGFALAARGLVRESLDEDEDGVADFVDSCTDTAIDDVVDTQGCSPSQLDGDGDGVSDADDLCVGFDDLLDLDLDGIPDDCDSIIDSDGDAVADHTDQCPTTPHGDVVDAVGCWPYSPVVFLALSPGDDTYTDILPLDFSLSDADRNISVVSTYLRSTDGLKEIQVWETRVDGGGELHSTNLDIWGFWAFFAPADAGGGVNTADVEEVVTVVVVWVVVELDIDGDTVANTTFLSTNITLVLGGFGEGSTGGEGGAMDSGSSSLPGKITWPLLALLILVIAYAIAAISMRRNDIRGGDDGSLQGPYCEAE